MLSHLQTENRKNRTGLSRSAVLGLCAALALAFLAAPTAAQLTGRLAGQVIDADGTALPGVTVTVNSPNLMGSRTDFADADGGFSFPSLPPGVYTVEAELDGFIPQQRTEVEVRLNRVTEIHFSMPAGEFGEEVMVVAETPVVDPEQVSTSQTFGAEYLKKASIGSANRSYQSVLTDVGGVAGGSNPNVFGSTLGENSFVVDGVNTTDPVTATWNINMNFDTVQEINFETSGFEARYGNATGGVVNVVTKSGGNSFSGSLDVRYRDTDFNTSGEHFDTDDNVVEFQETAATLGGPIRRDELWFFAAANPVRSKNTPTESPATRDFEGMNLNGKLTWQVNPEWQLTGRHIGEDATITNANASRSVAPEATRYQEQPKTILGVDALGLLTSNLQWHIKAGTVRGELNSFPQSRDFDTIGHVDSFGDGSRSVNYTNQQFSTRDRDDLTTNLVWFTDGAAGDHQVEVGVEYASNFFASQNNATGGGYSFGDRFGAPYTLLFSPIESPAENDGRHFTAYVQDTWRVLPNLTLKLGLRHDEVAFENDIGDEVAALSKLQPRFGIAWDIGGDARTVARANWGRFMHPNALTLPSFARVNQFPTVRWISCSSFRPQLGANCRDAYPGEQTVGGLTFSNWIADPAGFDPNGWFYNTVFSSTASRISADLEPTYADQWSVGVERELTRRTSIGLTYITKETLDIFEDTCNGNLPAPAAGADCDFYVMANLPGLVRDYSGFVLDFESRFTDWFHVLASYTNSESEGNVGYTQNAGVDFDIYPDHFENTYGYLSDHRRHRVKVNGFVDLPLDFGLAVEGFWSSAGVYAPTEASETYGRIFTERRGSREANDRYGMDVQVSKGFVFGRDLRFELIGAVFNVFDEEQVTTVCTRVEGCAGGLDLDAATAYVQPRRFEAGIRFEF